MGAIAPAAALLVPVPVVPVAVAALLQRGLERRGGGAGGDDLGRLQGAGAARLLEEEGRGG